MVKLARQSPISVSMTRQPQPSCANVPRIKFAASGFTLLELLVVVAILGLLMAYVGPRLMAQLGKSETTAAQTQVDAIRKALIADRLDTGRYPTTEQGLGALMVVPAGIAKWNGPYLEKALPADPWGRAYLYRVPSTLGSGRDFDVVSYGKDGAPGGTGDDQDVTN